jgi:hypothetical protein
MSTQKREPGKNYIGLMTDRDREQRAVEPVALSGRRLREYFLGLVATMFAHRSDAS